MHEEDSARRPSARFAYRRFGSLLVIGETAAAAYRERLLGLEVATANNFLLAEDSARFMELRPTRSAATCAAVLGVLGHMIPEKGLLELVEELSDSSLRPLWRQLIAVAAFPQDEAYERGLRARIHELGLEDAVRPRGRVPRTKLLVGVDALVVPSTGNETSPTVIIEVAACVPVIVRSCRCGRLPTRGCRCSATVREPRSAGARAPTALPGRASDDRRRFSHVRASWWRFRKRPAGPSPGPRSTHGQPNRAAAFVQVGCER